ncbi:DUF6657 family protein [Desulfotalea psychrophila]|uniref:Uncharacterized protein n=1 Tax=Desulfotalea psychrophila (strain LSv54 / DSM 12343) TaxID=177439 RepID=Q6AS21_DESPS|nr:DUF6657 family protein [Desulfotalea psychrophila]CAG34854.1 unknown protein [Desulfotalea psychrophila LSv54]
MAEIKSTIEMVLERAARMEKETTEVTGADYSRDGMRLGASFMNGKEADIMASLRAQDEDKQTSMKSGILQTLLRNITLPRDTDMQAAAHKALSGLIELCQGVEEPANICTELQTIVDQYAQHKEQSTEQLENALRDQMQQQYAAQGREGQEVNPVAHPQYAAELSKMLDDLNQQYTQAIEQRKEIITQLIGA